MVSRTIPDSATVRDVVADVPDPELPMITIADLGILRAVSIDEDGHIEVVITPTYSGCPAMDTIRSDIEGRLAAHGWHDASVTLSLSPPWTTDWITPEGRAALRRAGIAPPGAAGERTALTLSVRCPQCGSPDTAEISRFGSTPCKALWTCRSCREPFDHIKAI